jgi:hypothetical protein
VRVDHLDSQLSRHLDATLGVPLCVARLSIGSMQCFLGVFRSTFTQGPGNVLFPPELRHEWRRGDQQDPRRRIRHSDHLHKLFEARFVPAQLDMLLSGRKDRVVGAWL